MNDRPADLYRFYDQRGRLLYVGISLSYIQRMTQHRADKPWWDDVARVSIERFGSRPEAAAAEVRAIANEEPLHNVAHNSAQSRATSSVHDLMVGDIVALGSHRGNCVVGAVTDITGTMAGEMLWVSQRTDSGRFNAPSLDCPSFGIAEIYYVSDQGNSVAGAYQFQAAWISAAKAKRIAQRTADRYHLKSTLQLVPT